MTTKKTPVIPITSKYFKYTSSIHTDIRKTFERVKKEQERFKAMTVEEVYNELNRENL